MVLICLLSYSSTVMIVKRENADDVWKGNCKTFFYRNLCGFYKSSISRKNEGESQKKLNQSVESQEPCKELNKMLKTACWKAHLCLLVLLLLISLASLHTDNKQATTNTVVKERSQTFTHTHSKSSTDSS